MQTILPGGSAKHFAYNPQSALVTNIAVDPAGNPVMARAYQRNAMGNILGQNTELGNFEYAYDLTDQLTNVILSAYSGPSGVATNEYFAYDPMGNREEYMRETNVSTYSANSLNQYSEISNLLSQITMQYDLNGNQLVHVHEQGGAFITNHLTWDTTDRLISLTNSLGDTAEYSYDPFGRRLSKTVNGITNYFLYADEGLIAEYDGEGNQTRGYGYTPGSLWMNNLVFLKTFSEGATNHFYAVNDHLGALQKLIANNGAVVWSMAQDAFGNAVVDDDSAIINNLRFSSQYYDAESGLHYNTMRYYDPGGGRYLNRDPIGEVFIISQYQSIAKHILVLYLFVDNKPIIASDFTGLVTYGFTVHVGQNDQGEFGRSGASIVYTYDCCKCSRVHFIQQAYTRAVINFYGFWPVTIFYPWHYDNPDDQENFPVCPNKKGWGRASMADRPGYSETSYSEIISLYQMFKTEAICMSGPDAGKSYGVVNWGHYYSRNPDVAQTWHTP